MLLGKLIKRSNAFSFSLRLRSAFFSISKQSYVRRSYLPAEF